MIAVLYEGKKEKRRVRLNCSRADIVDTIMSGKILTVEIPLKAPCKFDRLTLYENGAMVLKNRFDQMCFNPGPFTITLNASKT